jgi:ornithine carbamoyltransferase
MDASPGGGALFLHDLPAPRGEEVTAESLDGPARAAFEQGRRTSTNSVCRAVLDVCVESSPID